MVRIPNIKIPSVRVGSIGPTSNIGAGGATPAPPTPITYLTQWKIVGNSEVHGQEIWSCGEYNPIDGKWHIRILPEGYGIVDIALDEPLRKFNDAADTIEFANGTTVVTRNIASIDMSTLGWMTRYISAKDLYRYSVGALNNMKPTSDSNIAANMLCAIYTTQPVAYIWNADREGIGLGKATDFTIYVYDSNYDEVDMIDAFVEHLRGVELIYELATPTTETIQVPQIEEAESYSCVISQGAKAVSWSNFETNSE